MSAWEWTPDELVLARSSPVGFGHVVSGATRGQQGAYLPFEHLTLLNDELLAAVDEQDAVLAGWRKTAEDRGLEEAVARELCAGGRHDRLVVTMPPRHGKSETTSKYTPAWYLGSRPERRVILAAYEAHFASTWGRKARDLLEEHGPAVFGVSVSQKSAAANAWDLRGHTGGMVTAGVMGPITGKGAELFLIDDPVKNNEDAASDVLQVKQFNWWQSTARTRLQKGAIVILIMTRWHEADLVGRLLAHDEESDPDAREGWRVIELPAIAEPDPETGVFDDALGRQVGEPLCPQLGFGVGWARRTKAAVGTYWWSAMFQCRPRPAEGLLFKRDDLRSFTITDPAPGAEHDDLGLFVLEDEKGGRHPVAVSMCTIFQTADTAASESEMADYTVIGTWAVTPKRELLLLDVQRERFEDTRVGTLVINTYEGDSIEDPQVKRIVKAKRPVRIVVENASSGPKVIKEVTGQGYPVTSANPDKDKVTRALLAVARYESHSVFHLTGARWRRPLEGEMLAFPNSAHDDQVDMVSYAAIELPRIPLNLPVRSREPRKGRFAGVRNRQL